MTDPLSIFFSQLERPDLPIPRHVFGLWPIDLVQFVTARDLVREAERAKWVLCPECFSHEEEVIVGRDRGGSPCYAIPCPEVPRAEVSLEDLRQWRVDPLAVASLLATTLRLGGNVSELAPGRLWRLGRWRHRGQARDMLLAVGLNQPDAVDVRRRITASKRPVVLVPLAEPDPDFWVGKPPPLIRLSEVVSLVDGAFDIDTKTIVGLIHDANERAAESPAVLDFVIGQKVRSAIDSKLTDELILQAYLANGSSARKAAKDLTSRGHSIHHATVSRLVKKYEKVLQAGSSDSVVRTRSSQRRDTPIKNRD